MICMAAARQWGLKSGAPARYIWKNDEYAEQYRAMLKTVHEALGVS
jgi:hypothetical protein